VTTEQFICDNGATTWGQSVYVVGSVPGLGNWDPSKAVKLDPTNYPHWTGTISNLQSNTAIQWKCIKQGVGPIIWQPDPNNSFTSPAAGQVGTTNGAF
jgi:alpha-glucosidase